MSMELLLLLALWTLCEAAGQILFKYGVDAIGAGEAHFGFGMFRKAFLSPPIIAGVLVHVIEFGIWIEILGRLPLSVAFPLESISYVTVLVATRVFLHEAVPPKRWAGVGLICAGIAVLGVVS